MALILSKQILSILERHLPIFIMLSTRLQSLKTEGEVDYTL